MKYYRLRKNSEFQKVFQKKESIAAYNLVMYIRENHLPINRLGVSVSKKVGKSVTRSRVKRYVKESYLLSEPNTKKGYDLVVIARVRSAGDDFFKIKKSYDYLIRKHHLLKK